MEELLRESPFYWTSPKIAFVEFAYSLIYSGSINNENVDIKELSDALCKFFHIDNLNLYRLFVDLKARKKNQTLFLDKLRESLRRKMEEE